MIQDTVVIGGECSLETRIEGDCDLTSMVEGDPDVLVVEGGGQTYPHYSGSYTVNPSTSQQVLQTDGKVMDDDVTVEAVVQGSATTPATSVTANPSISVSSAGVITATVSKSESVTPTVVEGYVSSGIAGTVSVSGSATENLTTQGATTYHVSSSDQTIASGKYLTGNQTFKAVTVSGLTADKVLSGTTVKIGDADDDDRIMKVVGTAQGGITPTGTKQITSNGTSIDVYSYQYADVAVPNSYSAGDEGKVVSNGALVAQTSDTVTTNDTYDTTLINSLTVDVSGGGSGLVTVASGTYTGADNNPTNAGTGFSIGKKMPKTDFIFRIIAQPNSEFPYDTYYKYTWGIAIIDSDIATFDLSSAGTSKQPVSVKAVKVNNGGTVSNVDNGSYVLDMGNIRNASSSYFRPNNFRIDMYSDRFEIRLYHSNASYLYANGVKYDWEIIYFGSNPSTDIVDLS